MKSDHNGCSTCPVGGEQYELYVSRIDGKSKVQYDYRHTDGQLFSCVAPTLDVARRRRDAWLGRKGAAA